LNVPVSTVSVQAPLLRTKLTPPPRRAGFVARPHLLGPVPGAGGPRLTLVSAPAGWGKTTALAEWAAAAAPAAAWVSLDESDNDPTRFWGYVLEALRGAGADLDVSARLVATADVGLTTLINAISALPSPVALALDDYHVIRADDVHSDMAFLVEHLPPTVSVALATRTDPPLGLPRLRARGELLEVRADDLRFDRDEAASLLREAAVAPLDDGTLDLLRRRTEGWAAGLYLAALSLRGRDDPGAFVDAFAGDDRLVVDYLATEVLAGLPLERRRFLLHTAILSQLSAPLCEAVTGRADAQRELTELERSNMFLVPLDSRRGWYRFHHLFGELLRHELVLSHPDEVAGLHRRAAGWLSNNGFADEAIGHLAAAGDLAGAADLIAGSWQRYHRHGWLATIERWMELLPEQVVLDDPRLCLARAWIAINLGRQEIIADRIAAAEAAVGSCTPTRDVAASIATARSIERLLSGDTAAALAAGERALELLPQRESQWGAVAYMAVGMAHFQEERSDQAQIFLTEAADVGERTGIPIPPLLALCHLAAVSLEHGDVAGAERHARRAIALADTEEHAHFPHAAGAFSAMAEVHLVQGHHARAMPHAHRGVELALRGRVAPQIAHSLLVRAAVHEALGERDAARADVRRARVELTRAGTDPSPRLTRQLLTMEGALRASAPARAETGAGPATLTARERTVLGMLAGPASLREIAAELSVSPNTVKTQVRSVYRKLGVARRSEAVQAARTRGISPRA